MSFHFGFDKRTLIENGIYGVFGWFRNIGLRPLNSWLTCVSIIVGVITIFLRYNLGYEDYEIRTFWNNN